MTLSTMAIERGLPIVGERMRWTQMSRATRRGWNALFCRRSSLHWPMVETCSAAHSGGMAAFDASLAQSRELGLAAVAHLSRYRGTSREHTESDLRVFFGWCQDRHLAPRRRPARRADGSPACRPTHNHALRPRTQESRPAPQLHPRRVHGVWNLTRPMSARCRHLSRRRAERRFGWPANSPALRNLGRPGAVSGQGSQTQPVALAMWTAFASVPM